MKRTALRRRTPLRSTGRSNAQRRFSEKVKRNAGGRCEAPLVGVVNGHAVTIDHDLPHGWEAGPHPGGHAHHVLTKARGGSNDPANGRWLCRAAHDWVHAHPAAAQALGLLRSSHPGEVRSRLP